ncbi:MAG: hypothetical protein J0M12_03300 [Deltaproteobacteria bacterium]|nr:hypothetical protein [Deltaproteobacteria bacterium]
MKKLHIVQREISRRLWDRFLKTTQRRPAITFLALTLTILAVASMVLFEAEGDSGHPIWRTIVYLTSGVDVDPPQTNIGQLTVALVVLCGLILASLLTGYIASEFSRLLQSASSIPKKGERQIFEKHLLFFGWNAKTKAILRELNAEALQTGVPMDQIVIVSQEENLERGSEEIYSNVWHVRGSSTDPDVLNRADLTPTKERSGARVAVILGDSSLPSDEADRISLLTLLAVEHMYPGVISLVDAFCDESEPHFRNADADEVVVPNQYANLLLARAAEFPGLANYIDELLALAPIQKDAVRTGATSSPVSLYIRTARELRVSGLYFADAVEKTYARSNAIVAGKLRDNGVELFPDVESSAPPLMDDDQLVLIATSQQAAA